MQIVLEQVADQLKHHGWQVNAPIYSTACATSLRPTPYSTRLSWFQRWPIFLRLRQMIPAGTRQSISSMFMPLSFLKDASHNLRWVEQQLTAREKYDVIVICPDYNVPGMLSLAISRHPRVVVISLNGLTEELTSGYLTILKGLAVVRLRGRVHPFLFRRVKPSQIELAVFASRHWQDDAIRAGLPVGAARTIYFGTQIPPATPRTSEVRGKLLWVGRLAPEKGLHVLLGALPTIAQRFPEVSLTAVAGQGEPDYRTLIKEMIRQSGLESRVTLCPPVEHGSLQSLYSKHDLLFFYSVYSEPVALVLMGAYAAGLPVVASKPGCDSKLVQDNVTCICYEPGSIESLANAITRVLTDPELRRRNSQRARHLLSNNFSLEDMGNAYDVLLRQYISQAPHC